MLKRLLLSLSLILGTCLFGCVATPMSNVVTAVAQQSGNPDVKVWVNTQSGVYHCPGTRWYGNTKSGEYMTQKQAQTKGYRPAYGKACQ
ncbi:MAG: hypothetical protein ABR607_11800 [Pyrinomonadaceae bacterium]